MSYMDLFGKYGDVILIREIWRCYTEMFGKILGVLRWYSGNTEVLYGGAVMRYSGNT